MRNRTYCLPLTKTCTFKFAGEREGWQTNTSPYQPSTIWQINQYQLLGHENQGLSVIMVTVCTQVWLSKGKGPTECLSKGQYLFHPPAVSSGPQQMIGRLLSAWLQVQQHNIRLQIQAAGTVAIRIKANSPLPSPSLQKPQRLSTKASFPYTIFGPLTLSYNFYYCSILSLSVHQF